MKHLKYRPEIDGLRAIAILSVLFFHVGFAGFSGGYVGVDVFFVISGYLITKLIKEQIESGVFSFSNFYLRRARRLFPALFVTFALSTLVAILIFTPANLERSGGALLHALASLSNVFFWLEADYFDVAAKMKPFLHTWSLSIEEQFYIIWPFTFVLLLKFKQSLLIPAFLVLIAVVSLLMNHAFYDGQFFLINKLPYGAGLVKKWISDGPATIFYLLPFRIFEFAIGAILVWIEPIQPKIKYLLEPLLLIGLGLIAYSVYVFDDNTIFPYFNALIPCVGVAVAIYAGRAQYAGKILTNPVTVGIGLISYSLYLVHWPIIVFWEYYNFGPPEVYGKVVICFSSMVIAYLIYRFVEQPFRNPAIKSETLSHNKDATFVICMFALTVILFIVAGNIWKNDGWTWRLNNKDFALSQRDFHKQFWGGAGYKANEFITLGTQISKESFIFTGDSFGLQYAKSIDELSIEKNIRINGLFDHGCLIFPDSTRFFTGGVEDKNCSGQYKKLLGKMNEDKRSTVIMAYSWGEYYKAKTGHRGASSPIEFKDFYDYESFVGSQIEKLMMDGGAKRKYFLIGAPNPSMPYKALDCLSRPSIIAEACKETIPEEKQVINDFLKQLSLRKDNLFFIDPNETLCEGGDCLVMINGMPIHSDGAHLSVYGAELVAPVILSRVLQTTQ